MRPRHTPKQRMTQEHNTTVALMKVGTAPLDKLTDANLESIARSHHGRRPGDYERLLGRLKQAREMRQEREWRTA